MMEVRNIPLKLIMPHPLNPRKELGDISELTESIKANGVLQNCSVVKAIINGDWYGTYYSVIGHRRCAASLAAGLYEVPCTVEDWDEQEQIAVMAAENIHRRDLTVYEQAQCYQMMLDVGLSVSEISRKTGISESTVRRRVKLAEFDREELISASGKAITFDELDRLARIRNVEERNTVLSTYGTPEYGASFDRAITRQTERENAELFRATLEGVGAIPIDDAYGSGYATVGSVRILSGDTVELTGRMEDGIQYYYAIADGWCYLRTLQTRIEPEEEADTETKPEEKPVRRGLSAANERRRVLLEEATERAYRLRTSFICSISEKECRDHVNDIIAALSYELWAGSRPDVAKMYPYIGGTYKNVYEAADSICEYHARAWAHRTLFWEVCALFGDSKQNGFYVYTGNHYDNYALKRLYSLLEKLGYEKCAEEKGLESGNSRLFKIDTEWEDAE